MSSLFRRSRFSQAPSVTGGQVVLGSYVGDGKASHLITVGFQPRWLFIFQGGVFFYEAGFTPAGILMAGMASIGAGFQTEIDSVGAAYTTATAFDVGVINGFTGPGVDLNASGSTYYFIVIG